MALDLGLYSCARVGSIPATSKGPLPAKMQFRALLEVRQRLESFGRTRKRHKISVALLLALLQLRSATVREAYSGDLQTCQGRQGMTDRSSEDT